MQNLITDAAQEIEDEPAGATSRQLIVPAGASGRLDKVLAELMADISRSRLRQWIDAGAVTVNDEVLRARDAVGPGDVIVVQPQDSAQAQAFAPQAMPLEVVFEDESILVLNKPAGLVVHPAPGHWSGTLVNGLLAYDARLAQVPRAGIVHRLDADTSGLMVVARSLQAHASLVAQLQARSVSREYWAVVYGHTSPEGTIDAAIGRDPRNPLRFSTRRGPAGPGAKEARTHWRALAHTEHGGLKFSWLACRLETGRTHQIRVHLESIRHPLVGDPLYHRYRPTQGDALAFERQALHAARLGLEHPVSGEALCWSVLPPADMRALMRALGFKLPRRVISAFTTSAAFAAFEER